MTTSLNSSITPSHPPTTVSHSQNTPDMFKITFVLAAVCAAMVCAFPSKRSTSSGFPVYTIGENNPQDYEFLCPFKVNNETLNMTLTTDTLAKEQGYDCLPLYGTTEQQGRNVTFVIAFIPKKTAVF